MTIEEENKELVRQHVNDVFVEGKLERIDEYVSEDYVGHNSGTPGDLHGPEGYKEFVGMIRSSSPDLDVTIEDLIAEGNKVVQRSRQTGTHEDEFMGIEPTGNTWDVQGIIIYEIEDGQIVEEWAQIDMMGLMQQLGVTESPG